ncbi:hypothetical protein QBC46DRAFT_338648 [Diplogelasinospora grovesii]|uniref:Uncharacterized protein n=1 Tax=Diplogelasinospora grovesii TaxID=303347 RepID=A0AAN6S6X8_9PEZI|nr:hypothetical protein QBC46DRAFT_338648 [Diplogelasinospora grovesii]
MAAEARRTTNPGRDTHQSPRNTPTPLEAPTIIEIEDTLGAADTVSGDLHAAMETLSLINEPDGSRERARALARERHAA